MQEFLRTVRRLLGFAHHSGQTQRLGVLRLHILMYLKYNAPTHIVLLSTVFDYCLYDFFRLLCFSRQPGIAFADIRQLPVDVYRREDHAPRHGDPAPTPVGQRVSDGVADEPVGGHRRRVLGAHHRTRTLVAGRIHRASTGDPACACAVPWWCIYDSFFGGRKGVHT